MKSTPNSPRLPFLSEDLTTAKPRRREEAMALFSELGFLPPPDYEELLSVTDGATGPIGARGYVDLWGIDTIRECNRTFLAANLLDDLVVFGSDGWRGPGVRSPAGRYGHRRSPIRTLDRVDARPLGDTLVEALATFGEE